MEGVELDVVGNDCDGLEVGIEVVGLQVGPMVGLALVDLEVIGVNNIENAVWLDVVGDKVEGVALGLEVVGLEVGSMVMLHLDLHCVQNLLW